jgi:tetratricopeptide (TPR) repeat protein
VVSEAKRNLIEYMERMNKAGRLDEAFGQVKSFADQHSANQDIRMMLVELLRAASRTEEAQEQLERIASELEARGDRAGARKTRERIQNIDSPEDAEPGSGNDLVFLETGFEPPHLSSRRNSAPAAHEPPAAPPEPEPAPAPVEGLDTFEPPAIDAATVQSEQLADLQPSSFESEDGLPAVSQVDGLELDAPQAGGEDTGALEVESESSEEFPSLDFSVEQASDAPVELTSAMPDLELESSLTEPDDSLDEALALPDSADLALPDVDAAGTFVDDFDIGEPIELQSRRDDAEGLVEQEDPLLPSEEAAEATSMASAWDTPLAAEPAAAEAEPGDLSELDIQDLEDRILDDPDSGALHRALGDRLAREGDLGRAVEEFVLSITAFERDDEWLPALDAVDALLALEPDAIRHQQKRVELAYRSGDRTRLLGAYLGLAEALVRAEALDKAIAVYRRILEHDPDNAGARDALAWLEKETAPPAEAAPPAVEQPPAEPEPMAPAPPAAAAPMPAPPASRPPVADASDYVDLGSMVIDAGGPRDTRMRVDGERPTGDEQKDFQETLEQFKKGIEANLGTEDYEAHYDLGIAFKEMGLLDEAIAEFQKALRAPNGRLRTSEALGITFFEKQQFAIAETILRRAVEALEGGDDEKIGLLYWLGRACESQGKSGEARQAFERALAVDIRFMDLNDRIRQLAAGRSS